MAEYVTNTKKHFIRYRDMGELYSVGRNKARELAKAAEAEIKVGGVTFIDPEKLDAYIRSQAN